MTISTTTIGSHYFHLNGLDKPVNQRLFFEGLKYLITNAPKLAATDDPIVGYAFSQLNRTDISTWLEADLTKKFVNKFFEPWPG